MLAGDLWIALVEDEAARSAVLPEYTHLAFTVAAGDFERVADRIREAGAPIWQENRTEGASLYFADPNGHKLEIHASDLYARLRSLRQNPYAANGANLIEGSHDTVVAFLDALTYGEASTPELRQTHAAWRRTASEMQESRAAKQRR